MKNKRLAIIFVLVTLGGSPQVWRQVGNFVDAVQHKVQLKFLSRVLRPQSGSDQVEMTPVAQAEDLASCPASTLDQVSGDSKIRSDSSPRKVKAERRAAVKREEQGALAFINSAKSDQGASSLRPDNLAQVERNRLTMHGVSSVPVDLAIEKSNVIEVVVLPQIEQIVPAFIDSANLPKLKKTFDESKVTRQRTRYLISKPLLTLPPTRADAVGFERAG